MNFSRSHRLATKADYKFLFDKPNKINQRCLLALFKPNQKSIARLGLVVGKRAINSAVIRNRTKRILRESFRKNKEKLVGLDVIIIVKQGCGKLSKQELHERTNQLWEKLLTHS